MQNLKKNFKDESGSVLVGVLALTVVMAISAVGYAALVRNTVTNEVMAFDDARAYLVAEQGLLMVTNWVGVEKNWRSIMGADGKVSTVNTSSAKIFEVPSIYGDFTCEVELGWKLVTGVAGQLGVVNVKSRAKETTTNDNNRPNKLPYVKMLEWDITGNFNSSSGAYATFVNKFDNTAFTSAGSASSGGLHQRTAFFGPTHSNTPILLSQRAFDVDLTPEYSGARFFGSVTTWGGWYEENAPGGGYLHNFGVSTNNRNYSQGVMLTTGNAVANGNTVNANNKNSATARDQLNKVFNQSFNPYANQIKLEFDARDKNGSAIETRKIVGNILNGSVEGVGYSSNSSAAADHTVFIKFGYSGSGNQAYYDYSDAAGNFDINRRITYDIDKPLVLYAGQSGTIVKSEDGERDVINVTDPFNVMIDGGSQLAGKVTVLTAPNYNISFNLYKGDVLYAGLDRGSGERANFSTNIKYVASGSGFGDYISILGYNKVPVSGSPATTAANMYSALMQEGGVEIGDRVKSRAAGGSGEHVFGFYSGGDVKLNLFAPGETPITNEVNRYKNGNTYYGYNYTNGTSSAYDAAGSNQTAYNTQRSRTLTAQVFAIGKNGGKVEIPKGIGKLGSFVHVIGSVVMDQWWNQSIGSGTNTGGAGAGIRTYHDKRFIDGASPSAPGLGYGEYNGKDRLLYMRTYAANWVETNTAK
jgi:hypothetical protein